jgi:hypothetical protein
MPLPASAGWDPDEPGSGRDLERSLREHGQLTPLLWCRFSEAIEVVDGFKRLRAARQLGWAELRVEIREADRAEAKLLVFQSHRTEGRRMRRPGKTDVAGGVSSTPVRGNPA